MRKLFFNLLILCFIANTAVATESFSNLTEQATMYYNDNNIQKSLEILSQIPEYKRTSTDWLLLGNISMDLNKSKDALFMYKHAGIVDDKNYKAFYNMGNIYLDEDNYPLAEVNYKKVIKLKPEFAYAYYNLGCCYLKMGENKKAKTQFIKAIQYKNNVPDFYYNLALTYKVMKKEKLADETLAIYNKMTSDF